jgi:hypothetical protein
MDTTHQDVFGKTSLPEILSEADILGKGIFIPNIVNMTLGIGDRLSMIGMGGKVEDGFKPELLPLDQVPQNSILDTPALCTDWNKYLKARNVSWHASILPLSFPMTIWSLLQHQLPEIEQFYSGHSLNQSKISLTRGKLITMHIVEAEQWMVELSPLLECLVPLLRGITLDLFIIGENIVVEPLVCYKQSEEYDQALALRRLVKEPSYSLEWKSEKYESCIRVHLAKAKYNLEEDAFPISKYPSDITLLFDSPLDELIPTITSPLYPTRFVVGVERMPWQAHLNINKLKRHAWGPTINPFKQPLKQRMESMEVSSFACHVFWAIAP